MKADTTHNNPEMTSLPWPRSSVNKSAAHLGSRSSAVSWSTLRRSSRILPARAHSAPTPHISEYCMHAAVHLTTAPQAAAARALPKKARLLHCSTNSRSTSRRSSISRAQSAHALDAVSHRHGGIVLTKTDSGITSTCPPAAAASLILTLRTRNLWTGGHPA